MSRQRTIFALLGKRDEPTDAIEQYCRHLGQALKENGVELILHRVDWDKQGWRVALRSLCRHAQEWRGSWAFVQYTALAWSSRGFPLRFLRVLRKLRAAGARVAVVYHDALPFAGTRAVDRLRRHAQLRNMREASRIAEVAIITVPRERLSWLPQRVSPIFIPVGANFSASDAAFSEAGISKDKKLTIAVYSITGGKAGRREIDALAAALRYVVPRVKNLQLRVFGRNTQAAEADVRKALTGLDIEICVLGLLKEEEVARALSSSHLLLFVRGPISSRRGSAIAGIACGLPVIAQEGPETAPPITEAGLAFYSPQRKEDLGEVLLRVLEDHDYRASLAQKSRRAQHTYFSWQAIAARYVEFLKKQDSLTKASDGLRKP